MRSITDFTFVIDVTHWRISMMDSKVYRLITAHFPQWKYWNQYQERCISAILQYKHALCVFSLSYVPDVNQVSPSKKPRSRGLLHSLLCCLCHKKSEPPLKNNAPLLVEQNGTLSKVSSSLNIPLLLLLISTLWYYPPSISSLSSMWSAWLTATWCSKHIFLAQSFSCLEEHLSWAGK